MAGPAFVLFLFMFTAVADQVDSAAQTADLQARASEDLSAGRFEQARSGFGAILAKDPDSQEALFGFGIASFQLGRIEEALKSLKRYVGLRPLASEGHSVLGIVMLAGGERAAAKTELEQALRLDAGNLEAAKALAHIEAGDYRGARVAGLLQGFTSSPDFDDESRLLLATGYSQSGNDKEALRILIPMLEQRPVAAAEAFVLAATCAARSGDGAAAARACALGLRSHLNSDEIEQRCLEVGRKGYLDAFVSQLESTAGDKPEDVSDLIIVGRLMTDAGAQMGGAPGRKRGLEMLQKAVDLAPSNPSALYNLGRCLRVRDKLEEAITMLSRALQAQPDQELSTLIHTQLGLVYRVLSQEAKAEEAFRRAMEHNRKVARFLPGPPFEYYEFLQSAARRPQEADAVLDELLKHCPGFLPARLHRARSLARAGHLDDAAREAELVVSHADPANQPLLRSAHVFLYQLYSKHGRKQEAERHRAWLKTQ